MSTCLQGHFLIAASHLRDSNFFKSVVLVLEHNDEGAMGLVINQPTDLPVQQALAKHFKIPVSLHLIFGGGPVETHALLILHNGEDYWQQEQSVLPGVHVGSSADIFDKISETATESESRFQFRIFAGYSGWGAGQLESELRRGDWFTMPGDAKYVFADDPYDIYENVLHSFHEQHRLLKDMPSHPDWN